MLVPGPSAAEIEINRALKLALAADDLAEELVRALINRAALTAVNLDIEWVRPRDAVDPTPLRQLRRLMSHVDNDDPYVAPLMVAEKRVSEPARSLGKVVRLASRLTAPGR